MAKQEHLPTWISGKWCVAAFRDSLISTLRKDRSCNNLYMYFYAVTQSGWDQVRQSILNWKSSKKNRNVTLFVGTDHGITDPSALEQISKDGVDVRLMLKYHGVFHPKVVQLSGKSRQVLWVGSNNLTRDGLLNNVELAVLVTGRSLSASFTRWAQLIESASVPLTRDLLNSYKRQRRKFEKQRAKAKAIAFTWEKRTGSQAPLESAEVEEGDLIVEVMPKETGGDGKQLQLPVKAASGYFNVGRDGASKKVTLQAKDGSVTREVTMTMFHNYTVRIVIGDLEYRDRPCVIVFRREPNDLFLYEIVAQNIFPVRYKELLALCTEQTRSTSRRWGVA